MENKEISHVFSEIADLLEVKGENPFRIRSYRNAAFAIESLTIKLSTIVERDEALLEEIPSIGKSLHGKIVELLQTGTVALHHELINELSPGLLELLKVPGLGPKKVRLFYASLEIKDVDSLERAAQKGELRSLPRMGEKSEAKILRAIERYRSVKKTARRFRLSQALPRSLELLDYLRELEIVVDAEAAGSLRRWQETIGDLDILVTIEQGADPVHVMEHFLAFPEVTDILAKGETKSSVIMSNNLQVDLRVVKPEEFGSALMYFTGSKEHNVVLRERAKKMGLKLTEYGLFCRDTGRSVAGRSEEDVYNALELSYIPPEMRENRGEILRAEFDFADTKEKAKKTKSKKIEKTEEPKEIGLPKLIEIGDIKGDLHAHTVASDGSATIAEMADAAMARGYEYLAITDNSKAVGIARGLDEKKLLKHLAKIDEHNEVLRDSGKKLRLIKGAEVDIMADGSLDYPPEILEQLECVVASVHSGFDMEQGRMTDRVLSAIASGYINILAHPTGRLIGIREPYEIDMEVVIKAAREHNVFMELNCYPERLDLNDIHLTLAKEEDVLAAISTDSHSTKNLSNIFYGIHTAKRAWLRKEDVLNTRSLPNLLKLLKRGAN